MPQLPAPDYPEDVRSRLEADAREVIGRYPDSRSALLPLLHLVQAEEGHVSRTGIRFCADLLGLTTAEVTAVATFYTMYRRKPGGEYQVGVCTNTLCAVLGGDAVFAALQRHLGVGNGETTEDGKITLEHIECNAACDFAPVVMVNWEFFDNQTPGSAERLVDDLRAGRTVTPTRGAPLCTYKETARILAGFPRPAAGRGRGGRRRRARLARGAAAGQGRERPGPRGTAARRAPARRAAAPAPELPRPPVARPPPLNESLRDAAVSAADIRLGPRPPQRSGHRGGGRMTVAPEIFETSPEKLLTPVLSAFWDEPRSWTLETYLRHEGYQGVRKALAMSPRRGHRLRQGLRAARPRRRGLPHRDEVAVHPAGRRQAALPRGQRGRVRAGHLQGHPPPLRQSAFPPGGHADRLLRDPLQPRLHLSARRNRPRAAAAARGRARGVRGGLSRPERPGQRTRRRHHRARGGAGAYICGEETALLDSLEGRRGQPRLRPPFPAVAGLYACPTVVNNVESIASVPAILRRGKEWFRSMGSEKSPGFTLYSLSGHVASPGQYEAPLGVTLRQLLGMSGGMRPGHRLKFWTPGGSSTPLLTDEHLDVPLDYEAVGAAGSMLGTKALQCFDETTCVVRAVTRWTEFYAHESCGKCTPCREGTYWLVQLMRDIEAGKGRIPDLDKLADIADNINGKSFCALGDGAASPIFSSLKYFRAEYEQHVKGRGCPFDPAKSTVWADQSHPEVHV
ncbi:hypothetical protein GCM10020000_44210 [Streptomyces olivoverticillatus]